MIESVALLTANAIPTNRGSRLVVLLTNPTGTTRLIYLRYTLLLPDGRLIDGYEEITVLADDPGFFTVRPLTDGHLVTATLTPENTDLQTGELYGTIILQDGDVPTSSNQTILVSGYLSGYYALNYPLGESEPPNTNKPANIAVDTGNGTPGNDIQYQANVNYSERLIGARIGLDTDATVANRITDVIIRGSGVVFGMYQANAVTPASQSVRIQISQMATPAVLPTGIRHVQIPVMPYLPQLEIVTNSTNLQAGDQYYELQIFTERIIRF